MNLCEQFPNSSPFLFKELSSATWAPQRRMRLTNNLAACTLTTQEPSLTMWQIFPNASSTNRISSLEEGMGTMLAEKKSQSVCWLHPAWHTTKSCAEFPSTHSKHQEQKLQSNECVLIKCQQLVHSIPLTASPETFWHKTPKIKILQWHRWVPLCTAHTFQGTVDWGPKLAELQHCALVHNRLPTACKPERRFAANIINFHWFMILSTYQFRS